MRIGAKGSGIVSKSVAIIGAGAAGLMAANRLSALRPDLSIALYDAMPSPARKILMAGKSGLNLTHNEDFGLFCQRYGDARDWMAPMLEEFGPSELVDWVENLGQETFVGSSGRIFPKIMKASPLLRALMTRLDEQGVRLYARHRLVSLDKTGQLGFDVSGERIDHQADAVLLAPGGPSWPRLGCDGALLTMLEGLDLETRPYRPANCGFDMGWSEAFSQQWAGHPVKSIMLHVGDHVSQGDFVITRHGVEGSAVYGISAPLRDALECGGHEGLHLDLRPNQSPQTLMDKLARPRGKQSLANHLRKTLNLTGVQAALLKECTPREVMSDPASLVTAIKALPLPTLRPRPLEEAISAAGGVALFELNDALMAKKVPGLFLAGEMLDWEAPTGGYLLTGCFSQGYRAAEGIANYL